MNNLLKMEKYQLLHNKVYWGGVISVFLIGFLTADTYVSEVMGVDGGAAASLIDILNGMVYDSTFILIFVSSILALILGQEFSWRTIDQEICAGHTRKQIFIIKIFSYLVAFNLMAIVYPIAGCIREYMRFGIANAGLFSYNMIKAIVYSFLLNSAMLLLAIFFCYCFRSTVKAVAITAITMFVLSLYLGYGMMLGLPISFLPIFQIRQAISVQEVIIPYSLVVAVMWWCVLIFLSWRKFSKCDLK